MSIVQGYTSPTRESNLTFMFTRRVELGEKLNKK